MISRYACLVIFLIITPFFTFPEESEKFIVSFKPLIIKDIDENYLHLVNSFPMSIFSELKNAYLHHYSEKELSSLKSRSLKTLRNGYLDTLSDLIEKHDKFLFSKDYNETEYSALGEKITSQKELLTNLNVNDIESPEASVPIQFNIGSIDNKGKYNSREDVTESSDLIIKSALEKIDEWIYIKIWVNNTILDTEELMYESLGSLDNLSILVPEISSRLKTVLLGRSWAAIRFDLTPEDANIVVKDDRDTPLYSDLEFYYPGIYNIEISKPGFKAVQISVDLHESETKTVVVNLEEEKKAIISLQTFPSGADLYTGAMWRGKTPLLIENPVAPALLTFKLEGYNDSQYVFKSKDDRDVKIFMHSDLIDREKIINNKRNIFYKSFSYFLLSMPLTLVSYGLSSDYGYTYNRAVLSSYSSSEANTLMQLSTAWYYVYLSSMFINISLFVNTIFDLVDYIKSNNYL